MNRISGDLQIIDYTTQRVVATLQEHHYFDDVRHWEIKNTVDMLDFSVLENSEFVPYLQQQNLILKEVREGVIVPYVITDIVKDSARNILTVYASGLWTLLAFDPYISPQKITGYTAQQWLSFATVRTDWEVGLVETTGSTRSHEIKSFISPLTLLHDISVLFDNYELQYRVTVQSGKITHKYVDLVKQRGANTGKEVTLGKDLNGIVRKESSENVITALVPFVMGQDAEGNEKIITIESVNNGLQYIVDEEAYQRWNVNGKHRFGFYTPQTEDQDMTPARLLSLAKTELKKRVSTIVSYEVDAVDIHTVFGLDHEKIEEGDTVRIIDEGMTPTLYLEARCIAGDESRRDPRQNKYTFGNYREIVDSNEELRKLYQKMLAMINDKVPKDLMEAIENKVNDANSKADQAIQESKGAKDLATATQEYMEQNMVDIIEQPTAPTTGLKDGKSIWVDNSNPEEKVQKLWNNGQWIRITPDLQPLKNAVADAQQDITNAQQDLNTAKTQLQNEIDQAQQDIADIVVDVNNKVDSTWVNQQLEGKADKSGVYTKEYIDQNTVGKSVYETDKQGNVTRFTNLETKQTQTETALTNKAEKSEVTTLESNLTGVTNRVTNVEQTATGLTTRMTSAEGKINTATGNISDLQTKTNTIEQTANGSVQKITELTGRFDGMSIGSVNIIQGTEEIFNNPTATGNYNGFKAVPSPFPKYDLRNKELTFSVYFTGKITAKGTNPWLGLELGITFMDNTSQYLNGRIDNKIVLNQNYSNERFVFTTTKVNDKEIKSINVTMGARDLTGSLHLFKGQIEEGNKVTAWKLSPEELTTTAQFTQKTNEITQTVDTISQSLTSVTSRTGSLETKTNTIENTVNGQEQTITNISNRTGTLETKTNELRNDVDGNTSTITQVTQSLAGGNENYIIDSSANNVYPVFYDDTSKNANNATMAFENDSLRLTCNNYTDAFYQIGATALTNMHGFKAGDEFTLSLDLKSEITGVQTVIYQGLNGTTWSETEAKTHNNTDWTRITHTFKLASTTKGWFIRVRFPRNSSANTKKIWIKNVKLEQGAIATPWSMNNSEILKVQNSIKQTTNENSATISSIQTSGIVGANLVYNTDFSQKLSSGFPDGWTGYASAYTSYQAPWADDVRAGVFRLNRTNLLDTDPNSIISIYSNKFPVTLNNDYTWSVYMKVPNMATLKTKMAFIMEYYNASGTRVQYQDVSLTADEITSLTANKWTRIVRTLKPTTAGIVAGGFRLALFHNGDIYYRQPQVELGTVVTGWNKSTSDFAGNFAFEDLNSRTNTIKQTLDSTVSTVNTLSTTQGQHTTQITQQGTAITQMNNEINLRVKTTEMTDYIGKLGAENELRNSAFETKTINPSTGIITSRTPSLDKWTLNIPANVGGSVVAEATRNREGYNSAKIVVTGAGTTDRYVGISQSIPATINSGDYVFGAWFYVQDKALLDNGAVIKLQFFNGTTGSTNVQTELTPKLVNNGWVYAEVKTTAPSTTITTLKADIWVRRNGTLWVSQPMLQYGSNASAFMEHPQDYVNYDALVNEVAKKVATSDYNSKISTIESSIQQANNAINLRVLATDVYNKTDADGRFGSKSIVDTAVSEIGILKNQITLKVEAGGIASAINQTAQSVLIQASKIYLDGFIEAKHLKANKLVGVTIETEAQTFANAKLSLNRQNLTIIHNNIARGYLGFVDRTDGKYQPMIQIGGSYVKDSSASVDGSMIMSVIEDYSGSASLGVIGMAKSMSGNDISYYNSIKFNPISKRLDIESEGDSKYYVSDGDLEIKAYSSRSISGFVNIEASKALTLMSNNGRINFNRTYGSNSASLNFSSTYDIDFNLGHLTLRVSNHPDYSGLGFQVMNGSGFANMKLNILRTTGNMSSEGTIYAVAFQPTSSRKIKTNFTDLPFSALQKVNSVNIKQYNFIKDVEAYEAGLSDKVETYYGMIAEDVDQVFASPERDSVNLYNISSISLQAIQELDWKTNNIQFDIGMLKQELEAEKLEKAELQNRLATLEALVASILDK
ncbi:tail fiber domain-containing protein [Bacillus cereus]|uniref:phage tail spike protein n=1 Tax=Bacillus cereus TaxID=1396 RepID=UPI001E39184B|nr:phage tail spike protein [Bacillus cereus]MCC2397540.1 tail fiber domain-containing protein [Bacillus cereus]